MRIISFSGIDGSGKSTMAKRAQLCLNSRGADARLVEVYKGSIYITLGRIVGVFSDRMKSSIESIHNKQKGIKPRVLNLFRKICLALDIIIFSLRSVFPRVLNSVIVCDRYFFDTIVHYIFLGVLSEPEARFFLKIVPRPDIAVVLTVDEKTAQAREGDHADILYYEKKNYLYKKIAKELGLRIINTSKDVDNVWAEIKPIVSIQKDADILMVSRAIEQPWDEASKNLVRDIISRFDNYTFHILTTDKYGNSLRPNVIKENIYTNKVLTPYQKIRLFVFLLQHRFNFDIYHFCFTPEPFTSFLIRKIINKHKSIQNMPYLTEKLRESKLKKLIYSDVIVVNSEHTKQILDKHGVNNVVLIYPSVDTKKFCPRAEKDLSDNENFKVLWPGKFASDAELSGLKSIISKTCSLDKRINFIIAARLDGRVNAKRQEALKSEINRLGFENRVAIMNRTIEDMAALISSCDLLIYPFFEGFKKKIDIPYVIIEAMASAKPILISDKKPINEVIRLGAGMVLAKENAVKFAEAIIMLSKNYNLRKDLGARNRDVALRYFDLEKNIAAYEHIYTAILRKECNDDFHKPHILKNNELAQAQRELLDRALECYDEISLKFAKDGLRFFVMKTFRTYPYADNDMDIVLVDKSRRREYLKSLEELGFKNIWNASILREPRKRFYVKSSDDGKAKLPIAHVHFTVSWNGIDCLDAEKIWARLRKIKTADREVMSPSVEDELLIMAAHTMHENTYVTAGELLHLSNLIAGKSDIDTGYIIESCEEYNWRNAFRNYILYADKFNKYFTGKELFPVELKNALCAGRGKPVHVRGKYPPYFLPRGALVSGYAMKTLKDFFCLKLRAIPRELLTFGLVIWLFRRKKADKFN